MDTPDRLDEMAVNADLEGILASAARAQMAADAGVYCECEEPALVGLDLMCGRCLLQNRGQEVKRVHLIVDVHEFVPGKLRGLMCAVCTQRESEPRHQGAPAVGRTSWGETVQGVA